MTRVRPAYVEDYEALCTLWREADALHARLLPDYFRVPKVPPRSRAEVHRILAAPDETICVADEAPEIVGMLHVQLYDVPPSPGLVPRRRAHVENVIVAQNWRRRGIGRLLMEEATAWARRHLAAEVVLTVWAGNTEAEQFYRALGFHQVSMVLGKRV